MAERQLPKLRTRVRFPSPAPTFSQTSSASPANKLLKQRGGSDILLEDIIDTEEMIPVLNNLMKAELAGVVRYTHYSLVITGPNRLPLVEFMKAQATESLLHAQQVGEILTGLGGHPEQGIATIEESHDHSLETVLKESIDHEHRALLLYKTLLKLSENNSVYLEEFARTQIGEEEMHVIELHKLLRDYSIG